MALEKITSPYKMKLGNQQKVLNMIYKAGAISRVEIAEQTNLTQQTITNIVRRLLEEKLVIECESTSSNVGRKPIDISINSRCLYAVGVEVTVRKIYGVLIDFDKKILAEESISVDSFLNAEHTLSCVVNIIDSLLSGNNYPERVKGIGISIEGIVDKTSGIVLKASDLHWENFGLKEELESRYVLPVYIENDVNVIALVENLEGLLKDSQNNIVIKLDQGIGSAIVFNKILYTGSTQVAGELGHYKCCYGEEAIPCHCGGKGCLTTVASIKALEKSLGIDFDEIIERLKSEDEYVKQKVEKIGRTIGDALSNIITFFNPDEILFTGKFVEKAGFLIMPSVEERIKQSVPSFSKKLILKTTCVKNGAVLSGEMVIGEMFKNPKIGII